RRAAVAQAEAIIDTQVVQFMHWLRARSRVPLIRALRDQGERARREELQRAMRLLERGEDPTRVLESLSHSLTNKLLHPPTEALASATDNERGAAAELLARLYRLQ